MERGSSPFPRIYSDLEQSLKFSKAAEVLLFSDASLWDKFLALLSYYQVRILQSNISTTDNLWHWFLSTQGIGENIHVKGDHVEYEV